MARDYATGHGVDADGIAALYRQTFSAGLDEAEEEGTPLTERITFNNRQRLVVLAEHISSEVEQTLRYLRTRFGADVYGVEFSVHQAGSDTIINTNTVVGREKVSKSAGPSAPGQRESDESIVAKVTTDFLRQAVFSIEEWAANSGVDGLAVDHGTGSTHFIRYLGTTWVYYFYAKNWLYMSLYDPSPQEADALRRRLSKPEEVKATDGGKYWRCHVVSDEDLHVIKDLIRLRIAARRQP